MELQHREQLLQAEEAEKLHNDAAVAAEAERLAKEAEIAEELRLREEAEQRRREAAAAAMAGDGSSGGASAWVRRSRYARVNLHPSCFLIIFDHERIFVIKNVHRF